MYRNKIFGKIYIFISLLLTTIIILSTSIVYASHSEYLIPGGDSIGLKIDTGVYVAGKYQVSSIDGKLSPWKNSDIEEGDRIVSCNGTTVYKISDLNSLISNTSNNIAVLNINRDEKTFSTKIDVVKTINGEQTIGLYVKDRLIGIGTLTFINPNNKTFASLGHGISDKTLSYGEISGEVVLSNIESIKKGVQGISGEKRASLTSLKIGTILENNITGVYGKVDKYDRRKEVRIASQTEVKKGPAKILTVVENQKIEEFSIEILSIVLQNEKNIKGIKFKVTDNKLINKTGGIVQGMSGSPIIQNNTIIGAVSHVSVDDPTIGYGMHIEWMVEESNKLA